MKKTTYKICSMLARLEMLESFYSLAHNARTRLDKYQLYWNSLTYNYAPHKSISTTFGFVLVKENRGHKKTRAFGGKQVVRWQGKHTPLHHFLEIPIDENFLMWRGMYTYT